MRRPTAPPGPRARTGRRALTALAVLLAAAAGWAPGAAAQAGDTWEFDESVVNEVLGTFQPLVGNWDCDADDDLLWYAPGPTADSVWLSNPSRIPTKLATSISGTYQPVVADLDGDCRDDVLRYAPGGAADFVWFSDGDGTFTTRPYSVTGAYRPLVGRFTDDPTEDVLWYAPGGTPDFIWDFAPDRSYTSLSAPVSGTYTPLVADLQAEATTHPLTEVLWYGPGATPDSLWRFSATGARTARSTPVSGTYLPTTADVDGDGRAEVVWYSQGGADSTWDVAPGGTITSRAQGWGPGFVTPLVGNWDDFPGGTESLYFHAPFGLDGLTLCEAGSCPGRRILNVDIPFGATPVVGDLDGDGADDIWWYRPGPGNDRAYWGLPVP